VRRKNKGKFVRAPKNIVARRFLGSWGLFFLYFLCLLLAARMCSWRSADDDGGAVGQGWFQTGTFCDESFGSAVFNRERRIPRFGVGGD